MTCGECEYFGNYDKMIFGPWELDPETNNKQCRRSFVKFDETQGAVCAYPKTGTKTRVYDGSPACSYFKPRTWTRPENCDNCACCHGHMSDGSYLCSGWPFYKKVGNEPCQNGKAYFGENLRLF